MAYIELSPFSFWYLNPDGTWTPSAFKAHHDCTIWLDWGLYLIPAEFHYGDL